MAPIPRTARKESARARRVLLVALALLALSAAAPSAQALGPGKHAFTIHLEGLGLGAIGVILQEPDEHLNGGRVGVCWYYTPGTPIPPAGMDPDRGGVVYFPFVDTAKIIDYVHGRQFAAENGNQTTPSANGAAITPDMVPVELLTAIQLHPNTGTQHAGANSSCNDSLV